MNLIHLFASQTVPSNCKENFIVIFFLKKVGLTRPIFVYFRPLINTMTNIVNNLTIKSIDGALGIRIQEQRLVSANDSTEL